MLNYSTHKITLQHKQTNQVKKNKKKHTCILGGSGCHRDGDHLQVRFPHQFWNQEKICL